MNATARQSFHSLHHSRDRDSTAALTVSRPDLPGQNLGTVISLDRIDGAEFRAWFMVKLAEYLQSRFRNPEAVASAFGVRFTTACNWWNGDNRASGDTVAKVFMAFPDAVQFFMTEWGER